MGSADGKLVVDIHLGLPSVRLETLVEQIDVGVDRGGPSPSPTSSHILGHGGPSYSFT